MPTLNDAALSLMLIFIPGIICYGIIAALANKRERDTLTIFLQIFIYGVASYLWLNLLNEIFPSFFPSMEIPIFDPSKIDHATLNSKAILTATGIALLQGLLLTVNVNYDVIMFLCQKTRITRRFSDFDTWSFLLNSKNTDNWVTLRDYKKSLIYQGYVKAFSTGTERRELMLMEISVFDLETIEKVAQIPVMYLAFKSDDDIILEFGQNPGKVQGRKGEIIS